MAAKAEAPLLLIVSNEIKRTEVPGRFSAKFAVRSLMQEAEKAGFRVMAGPVDQFQLHLPAGRAPPRVLAGGQPIEPAAAIFRSTSGGGTQIARSIDIVLRRQGCVMLDPADRFDGGALDRIDMILSASGTGLDVERLMISNKEALAARLRRHDYRKGALVAKAMSGSGGRSVRWVDGSQESIASVLELAEGFGAVMPPFLIEPAMDIAAEFRIYTLDGTAIGCVRRVAEGPGQLGNASQGAELVEEAPPPEVLAGIGKIMCGGLVGWDVALLKDGKVVVIERNRPPAWKHFSKVSEVNIAALVIARLKGRLAERAARAPA